MAGRLRDMIKAIRATKTAAEERAVVAKECAVLRTSFKDSEQEEVRPRNVAKLMFIHMLGYPTHFGQMECLKLIAATSFPEKRIGYLGLMLLLDERQEVLMLVTNSLKNDLHHAHQYHANQFNCGLALCALGNIGSAEMARDLAPEVEKLLNSSNAYIRKKAALCSVHIVKKVADLCDFFVPSATGLLTDKHHGVLLAGVKLVTVLCQLSPAALDHFRKQTPTFVRILKNLVVSGYAPEYDVGGITDPYLQVRTLRLLRLVGQGNADSSDIMSDVLAQVATNTDSTKNAGHAILYECVSTIMAVEAIGGLRVLAINILGKFLANRDNNIRFVSLNTLVKVVSVDTQAVQRHRATIVECVKDSDVSIRRRALELVYALVNEGNVKILTKELLQYLKVSDPEFKPDLTAKLCALVQRFSPNKLWHIDIMVKVLVESGSFVAEEACFLLIVLISNAPELQGYAVRTFYRAFQHWKGQESLALVTLWCLGEYGEMLLSGAGFLEGEEQNLKVSEADTVNTLGAVLQDSRSTPAVRAYALIALFKLTARFPSSSGRIQALIAEHKGSLALELQQRSTEFSAVLNRHSAIMPSLVDKMPALDEGSYMSKRVAMVLPASGAADASASEGGRSKPSGPVKAAAAPQLADLLDFTVDGAAAPPAPSGNALLDMLGPGFGQPAALKPVVAPASSSPASASALLDLLSLGDPAPPPPSVSAAAPLVADDADGFGDFGSAPAATPAFPPLVALDKGGLRVVFDFAKASRGSAATTILATYTNSSPTHFTDFSFQAAVPKFMQLTLGTASHTLLPANSAAPITQTLEVLNNMHGQKALVMKLRISYKVNGREVLEQVQVGQFPAGL
eukprot:TRINITY_DN3990_c1_g3_i1.p1 TRINITY_DN3990_c1_g3~~TRINITY_DN3990_c1_g3_i1.p1  ORF type:complete len:853 (+),score=239.18 TRINITY_DN3990_c1_g3_i1:329-2887(+)